MSKKKVDEALLDEPLMDDISSSDEELDESSPTPDPVFKVTAKVPKDAEERVKIIIERQEGAEGTLDVPIAVNGRVYLIKRGYPVLVPRSVVEVLQNAVVSRLVKNDLGEEILMDMPRFVWRYV